MIHFKSEKQVVDFVEQMGWFLRKTEHSYQFLTDPAESFHVIKQEDILFEKETIEEVYDLANELYKEVQERFPEEGELDWLYEWMDEHLTT